MSSGSPFLACMQRVQSQRCKLAAAAEANRQHFYDGPEQDEISHTIAQPMLRLSVKIEKKTKHVCTIS